jgi:hypothetical protein
VSIVKQTRQWVSLEDDSLKNEASGFQPEGLSDSSRWSQRSVDHRTTIENNSTPETGVRKTWHPSGVRTTWALPSGGLRYAATTGYYLTALQAEIRSLRFHSLSTALTRNSARRSDPV